MVSLRVHLAEVIFVQKVVSDHQTLFLLRQSDVMGARVLTQVERFDQSWLFRVRGVEHRHLSRLVHGNEEPFAVVGDPHELWPSSQRDGREAEH